MRSWFRYTLLGLLSFFLNKALVADNHELPNYDIVVFDLKKVANQYQIDNPMVIAESQGYDNQPYFSTDSSHIYFTRIENQNADIWSWSLDDKKASRYVESPLSEYSPTIIPDSENSLSMVRVEQDGSQRLWRYSKREGFNLIFKTIKPVGYHAWSGDNIALFVLGNPHELRVTRVGQESSRLIDSNIGRCLQKVPQGNRISYTVINNQTHQLKTYDFANGKVEQVFPLPQGAEDYVWLDAETIISSYQGSLVFRKINTNEKWIKINNSTKFKLSGISRLALSSAKDKVAIVYLKP